MQKFTSIKNWASEDRPREKLLQKGPESLSNAELLAILINTGTANKSAIDIAKDILEKSHQNLLELGRLSLTDIKHIKGIGEKKAVTLMASLELGKRRQLASALERPKILSSTDSFNLLSPYLLDKTVEEFYVIFMNAGNYLITIEPISNGGITATVVDARIIFKKALEYAGVTQLIVAHNHPSGNLIPSETDKRLTEKIKEGGKLLDIRLLDHLIIASNSFYSFSDNGLL
ncbi:MAG: DNA repair protein RadC [Chitinophagaceae bacterium]|nr:DNA repair protein RadC [Chitinophagaceae bacterium]